MFVFCNTSSHFSVVKEYCDGSSYGLKYDYCSPPHTCTYTATMEAALLTNFMSV